jgi:hypothetical protein
MLQVDRGKNFDHLFFLHVCCHSKRTERSQCGSLGLRGLRPRPTLNFDDETTSLPVLSCH